MPAAAHRRAIEASRQRFKFRVTRRIVPCIFSIALVQASDRRSSGGSSGNASHAIAPRSSCRSCARSTGVKKSLDVHPVLDNYGTHKTPEVKAWLAKHQRFHCHFTPTSASWLNLVGRFFAEITTNRNRRGTFTSVAELEDAIYDYLLRHNVDPKPFVWTKSAEDILARERRALDLLDIIRDGYQPSESEHLLQPSSRCGASLRASVHFLPYPRFNLCLVCGTDV